MKFDCSHPERPGVGKGCESTYEHIVVPRGQRASDVFTMEVVVRARAPSFQPPLTVWVPHLGLNGRESIGTNSSKKMG